MMGTGSRKACGSPGHKDHLVEPPFICIQLHLALEPAHAAPGWVSRALTDDTVSV